MVLIATYLWKGCFDLSDIGILSIFEYFKFPNSTILSFIATGFIGYFIYFILLLIKKYFKSFLRAWKWFFRFKKSEIFLLDLIDFTAYLSIVFIWRTIWSSYDYYTDQLAYEDLIIISTHFGTFLFVSIFGISSVLYGPDGDESGSSENNSIQ